MKYRTEILINKTVVVKRKKWDKIPPSPPPVGHGRVKRLSPWAFPEDLQYIFKKCESNSHKCINFVVSLNIWSMWEIILWFLKFGEKLKTDFLTTSYIVLIILMMYFVSGDMPDTGPFSHMPESLSDGMMTDGMPPVMPETGSYYGSESEQEPMPMLNVSSSYTSTFVLDLKYFFW